MVKKVKQNPVSYLAQQQLTLIHTIVPINVYGNPPKVITAFYPHHLHHLSSKVQLLHSPQQYQSTSSAPTNDGLPPPTDDDIAF